MPYRSINHSNIYFERAGHGQVLVLIHGAFGDESLWDPQWQQFIAKYDVLRYDLRGHGKTGRTEILRYTIDTYVQDLASLLDTEGIKTVILCGLSWGGGIAQAFAVRYPDRTRALVLAGSTVSMSLTPGEKLLRYVLFPRWLMLNTIRLLGVKRFVEFSFHLAAVTLGRDWLHGDEHSLEIIRRCMLSVEKGEYIKIWDAIYHFDLQPIESITCPTLVLIGEHDNAMIRRHAAELIKRVPHAELRVLPAAYHAMTLEQPRVFNSALEEFLSSHQLV